MSMVDLSSNIASATRPTSQPSDIPPWMSSGASSGHPSSQPNPDIGTFNLPAGAQPPTPGVSNNGQLPSGDAYAYLSSVLHTYGLDSLTDWAWQQIVTGASNNEILQRLRDTPQFKERFKAITEREKNGLTPMSPAEVVAYENQARQAMRAAGLPPGFYDTPDDFVNFMAKDVSASELSARINQGFSQVANADPLVRKAFGDMFGPSGDAALASVFLDPDKALPVLENQVAAAQFAGTGLQFGFHVDESTAMSAAYANLPSYRVRSDWQNLASMSPMFEPGGGIDASEGIQGVFGIGNNPALAAQHLAHVQETRLNAFKGGAGAQVGGHGVRGLGSAEGNV